MELIVASADLTDWLQAIAGVAAALTTVVLAFFAWGETRASAQQARLTLRTVRAQVQPVVFARETREIDWGSKKSSCVSFPYYLRNDGLGVALEISHGIRIGALTAPGGNTASLQPRQVSDTFASRIDRAQLPDDGTDLPVSYWVQFKNVFGEAFETVWSDGAEPASFRSLGAEAE